MPLQGAPRNATEMVMLVLSFSFLTAPSACNITNDVVMGHQMKARKLSPTGEWHIVVVAQLHESRPQALPTVADDLFHALHQTVTHAAEYLCTYACLSTSCESARSPGEMSDPLSFGNIDALVS